MDKADVNSELEKIAYMYGDPWLKKKKQRRKRQKLLVIELLYDYAKNSTLHGLRYVVEQGITVLERAFWFLTVVASVVLCSFYVYNVVRKWDTSPIMVVFKERLSSVGSVPFPAVTVCPEMKISPYYYNYTDKVEILDRNQSVLDEAEIIKLQNIFFTLCDSDYDDDRVPNSNRLWTDPSFIDDIIQASPRLKHTMWYMWDDSFALNHSSSPHRSFTRDGVCYTFNANEPDHIFNLENVQSSYPYMKKHSEGSFNYSDRNGSPKHGKAFPSSPDLELFLAEPDMKSNCNHYSGYKIYLHHSSDYPQSSMFFYTPLENQTTTLAISVREFKSDDRLLGYDVRKRQCYFPTERKLRYFKAYTVSNCQAECISNKTYDMCQCVGFYMPHDNSSEICDPSNRENVQCIRNATEEATSLLERWGEDGGRQECDCLPACNSIEYEAEVLQLNRGLEGFSTVKLFYKSPHYVTMQRRELFGITDLLANIGGLLGVFLGFSFLSLVELFYFLGVRVGFVLKKDLDEEKANESRTDDTSSNDEVNAINEDKSLSTVPKS